MTLNAHSSDAVFMQYIRLLKTFIKMDFKMGTETLQKLLTFLYFKDELKGKDVEARRNAEVLEVLLDGIKNCTEKEVYSILAAAVGQLASKMLLPTTNVAFDRESD